MLEGVDSGDIKLLAELVRVVDRCGADSVSKLALIIKDPASARELADALDLAVKKAPPKKRASSNCPKVSSPGLKVLDELRKSDPEKHSIIAEIRSYLIAEKALPSMGELRQFANMQNLSIGNASSRRAAIVPFLRSIAKRPTVEADQLLRLMVPSNRDDRSLEGWRDVIVGHRTVADTTGELGQA